MSSYPSYPSPLLRAAALLLAAAQCIACADTGQSPVSFSIQAAGRAIDAPIEGKDGWQIDLTTAQLAFGPLVLCPGFQAGELCEVARAEWLDSAVVDALDGRPQLLGRAQGVSGVTRSWMYDLGIVSTLTTEQPLVLDAAAQLGDHSLLLAGVAERDDTRISFEARLRIQQEEGTERGVPIVRKSTSDSFDYDIDALTRALAITFDATSWVSAVDFDALSDSCNPATATTVCDIAGDSQGGRAIRNAVVAGARPGFRWQ